MVVLALALLALSFYGIVELDRRNDESVPSSKCCDDSFCDGDCGGWGA